MKWTNEFAASSYLFACGVSVSDPAPKSIYPTRKLTRRERSAARYLQSRHGYDFAPLGGK